MTLTAFDKDHGSCSKQYAMLPVKRLLHDAVNQHRPAMKCQSGRVLFAASLLVLGFATLTPNEQPLACHLRVFATYRFG